MWIFSPLIVGDEPEQVSINILQLKTNEKENKEKKSLH